MESFANYDLLLDKINTFIRKYYFNKLLRGLIFLGTGIFSAYIIIALSEYFGNFDTLFRTILFYLFITVNLGLAGWLVIPYLMLWLKLGQTLTHVQAAEIIGKHFSDVSDKLLNTLQLKNQADTGPGHRELILASIDQKIETLKPISFPSAVDFKENTKFLKWIVVPIAMISILALAAPSILTESTKRLIRHNEYFAPITPFKFILLNTSLSVVQGDNLKLELKLEGSNLPADVYLEASTATFKLEKEGINRFHYLLNNLQKSTSFKLSANGFSSAVYIIHVNLKPALLHFDAGLFYPEYLHKKNENLLNAGDMTVPAGTLIKWQLHTQNATQVVFDINGKKENIRPLNADIFEHEEKLYKSSVYKLSPQNKFVINGDSASYKINVIADEFPVITVQEKSDSVSMKAVYFNGKIQDDHGFSSLTFNYKIIPPGNKTTSPHITKAIKIDLDQTQADFFYYFNLNDLGTRPGDQISYFFEVADNDGVSGPKKVRSPEHTLNFPSQKDLSEQLNAGTKVIKQKMESAIKIAGQVEHESQKLNQLLLNKNSLSFEEKKRISDLLEKKRELDELLKDIQNENKKNLYNRQQTQPENKDLLDKQKQIENLFNNVLDQKTQDMLKKLQALMEQEQKDGTLDQLSKMQLDNKSLKKELDRILQLYKKLEFDQKLNQNIDDLNKLSEKQKTLAETTKQSGQDKPSIQKEQQKLHENFQDIKKSLDELQKINEAFEQTNNYENPKSEEQKVDQEMNKSTESLEKNDRQKAAQAQLDAAKQLQQMATRMQQKQQDGDEKETSVNIQQLRELLKNLVNSSFEQEKVMETLRTTNSIDPNYRALAQKQKDIKDNLKTAEDSLNTLSRRIPQIQSTVNQEISSIDQHIDRALENLGDRRTPEANREQQYAMTSMNNLALILNEALEQLQKSMKNSKAGQGKQKQPSLSQLNKMQQQLSQNMQKMRDQLQRQGNQGQSQHDMLSEQLARMAREQQIIRQQLEQINREENKDGTGRLGDLDNISKEMKQTESDLVNRRITDDLLKRQQQIQTRLLEAEKAEKEKEQDKQRESNVGKDVPPGYIKALQSYKQIKEKQTEQIRTVSPALNLYYKQKIKIYFDQLNSK